MYNAGVAMELVSVAALRARLSRVLGEMRAKRGPLYVTQRGEASAVLLAVDEYHALLEQLEYLDDSLEALRARERREAGREGTRPWSTVKRQRRGRGRVPR